MDFNEVRQEVFAKTPVFKRIVETYGHLPLEEYFSRSISAPCRVPFARQEELLNVVEERLRPLLGSAVAAEARREFGERYAVSTADHHGALGHPFFFSCHLAQAAALRHGTYRSIFVFSCGGVSLNNSSFPRGLLVHDSDLNLVRLPFFSLKHRHESVYGKRGYAAREIDRVLSDFRSEQGFSPVLREYLNTLIKEIYAHPDVVSRGQYADQITATNYALFKQIPGQDDMNFIMLQQEDLVVDLVVRYHLGRGTLLDMLCTDPAVLAAFEVCFDGIAGAFSRERSQGTLLLWALRRGERIGLWRVGNELVSADGAVRIVLTAENLKNGLLRHELVPSMALSFIVLSFYYGLTCGGGFSQVTYLTDMKRAYLQLLQQVGASSDEVSWTAEIETERLTAETAFVLLANDNQRVLATALDMIIHRSDETILSLNDLTQRCPLAAAIDQLIPEVYRIVYRSACPVPAPEFPYRNLLQV